MSLLMVALSPLTWIPIWHFPIGSLTPFGGSWSCQLVLIYWQSGIPVTLAQYQYQLNDLETIGKASYLPYFLISFSLKAACLSTIGQTPTGFPIRGLAGRSCFFRMLVYCTSSANILSKSSRFVYVTSKRCASSSSLKAVLYRPISVQTCLADVLVKKIFAQFTLYSVRLQLSFY